MTHLSCFKAYDIRGEVDVDLTEDLARELGKAIAAVMDARSIVVGRDARAASPRLLDALAEGLTMAGVDVLDLGLCGTEEVYFATDHYNATGGVMVTASHNPIEFNGFKLVGEGSAPLTDAIFREIEAATASRANVTDKEAGLRKSVDCRDAYVARVLSFIDTKTLKPMKILANAGNGAAGPTFDAVVAGLHAKGVGIEVERLHHDPDATFPNGIPNPLLPENQPVTADAVVAAGADFGIAWDGDFDRCFFFDHTGAFIPGEYVVGLLAASMLERFHGEGIVHDPRVYWNTEEVVTNAGGRPIVSKTGHALIKAKMRETDAVYGGEMSAHHYFRDFMYCDSGMIPWVLIAAYISQTGQSLNELVAEMRSRFESSGEINFRVDDASAITERVYQALASSIVTEDRLDGLSLELEDWRLNIRSSNTEPLLRLNVEAKAGAVDLPARIQELRNLIEKRN